MKKERTSPQVFICDPLGVFAAPPDSRTVNQTEAFFFGNRLQQDFGADLVCLPPREYSIDLTDSTEVGADKARKRLHWQRQFLEHMTHMDSVGGSVLWLSHRMGSPTGLFNPALLGKYLTVFPTIIQKRLVYVLTHKTISLPIQTIAGYGAIAPLLWVFYDTGILDVVHTPVVSDWESHQVAPDLLFKDVLLSSRPKTALVANANAAAVRALVASTKTKYYLIRGTVIGGMCQTFTPYVLLTRGWHILHLLLWMFSPTLAEDTILLIDWDDLNADLSTTTFIQNAVGAVFPATISTLVNMWWKSEPGVDLSFTTSAVGVMIQSSLMSYVQSLWNQQDAAPQALETIISPAVASTATTTTTTTAAPATSAAATTAATTQSTTTTSTTTTTTTNRAQHQQSHQSRFRAASNVKCLDSLQKHISAKKLGNVRAVIIGKTTSIRSNEPDVDAAISRFASTLADVDVPVFSDVDIGHVVPNLPLAFGKSCIRLDDTKPDSSTESRLRISVEREELASERLSRLLWGPLLRLLMVLFFVLSMSLFTISFVLSYIHTLQLFFGDARLVMTIFTVGVRLINEFVSFSTNEPIHQDPSSSPRNASNQQVQQDLWLIIPSSSSLTRCVVDVLLLIAPSMVAWIYAPLSSDTIMSSIETSFTFFMFTGLTAVTAFFWIGDVPLPDDNKYYLIPFTRNSVGSVVVIMCALSIILRLTAALASFGLDNLLYRLAPLSFACSLTCFIAIQLLHSNSLLLSALKAWSRQMGFF